MMRIVWLTDIHLNFVPPHGLQRLYSDILRHEPDAILISGDIGESNSAAFYLNRLAKNTQRPIYFVLGNHDFYRGSLADVRDRIRAACAKSDNLIWLNEVDVIELTPTVGLVGHDSWADGRMGNYEQSEVVLNDYLLIDDFVHLNKAERLRRLHQLGDAAADHVARVLPGALARYPQVCLLTHVPPFQEACRHEGQPTDDAYLPHFGCQVVGEALREIMTAHPDRQLTVLCGHTHSAAQVSILPNLHVRAAEIEYRKPRVEAVLTLE
ncbi:MAG: metallophosphoesterase [Anaerolineae bacterium]|nr:metallophosphoesterase [Anaerolineae bacterium]